MGEGPHQPHAEQCGPGSTVLGGPPSQKCRQRQMPWASCRESPSVRGHQRVTGASSVYALGESGCCRNWMLAPSKFPRSSQTLVTTGDLAAVNVQLLQDQASRQTVGKFPLLSLPLMGISINFQTHGTKDMIHFIISPSTVIQSSGSSKVPFRSQLLLTVLFYLGRPIHPLWGSCDSLLQSGDNTRMSRVLYEMEYDYLYKFLAQYLTLSRHSVN